MERIFPLAMDLPSMEREREREREKRKERRHHWQLQLNEIHFQFTLLFRLLLLNSIDGTAFGWDRKKTISPGRFHFNIICHWDAMRRMQYPSIHWRQSIRLSFSISFTIIFHFYFVLKYLRHAAEWWCAEMMLIMDTIYKPNSKREIEFRF